MSLTVKEFWKLLVQSQVHSVDACRELAAKFSKVPGADTATAETLAQWLISNNALTRYQSKILLSGKPGPFVYGNYLVHDRVKSGRLAGLFRAVHVPTGHRVCLKFLAGNAARDPAIFSAVAEVAAAAAAVQSPYVVRCYEAVDTGTHKFIALEDLQGQALSERLEQGVIPVREACRIAREVALGLDALYEAGRGHNELRPENIWLDAAGHARVIQFPLERDPATFVATLPQTAGEQLAASAPYFAPEVTANVAGDERSDIYSLGCVLFQMLAGEPPFSGADPRQVLRQHVNDPVPPLDLVAQQKVPAPVAQVVGYMLVKDPAGRYQRTDQVAQALEPYQSPEAAKFQPPTPDKKEQKYRNYLQAAAANRPGSYTSGPAQAVPAQPIAPGVQPVAPVPVQAVPAQAVPAQAMPVQAVPAGAVAPAVPVTPGVASAVPVPAVPVPAAPVAAAGPAGSSSVSRAYRARRKNRNTMMVGGITLAAAGILVWIFTRGVGDPAPTPVAGNQSTTTTQTTNVNNPPANKPPQTTPAAGQGTPAAGTPAAGSSAAALGVQTVAVQPLPGESPWPTPAKGQPIEVRYLPRGIQFFLWLRPADLLAHPRAQQLVSAPAAENMYDLMGGLGPMFRDGLRQLIGVPPENLESVLIGLMPGEPGKPLRVAAVARMKNPLTASQLQENWGKVEKARLGEHELYANDTTGYYLSPEDPNLIVVAPLNPVSSMGETQPPIQEAIANAKVAPPLRRELEGLLAHTNQSWLCSVLFAPNFVFTEGDAVWSGPASILREPAERFLGDNAQAALISCHAEDNVCFLELRLYGDAVVAPAQVATALRDRVKAIPDQVKDFILSFNSSPYSRKILYEYPNMLQAAVDQMRVGTADGHAVLQFYLPDIAAPNLAYGSYLTLLERPGGGTVGPAGVAAQQPAAAAAEPKTAAEILAKKTISLAFVRDTLEKSMEYLSSEIGVPIQIIGADLQLEGITKNQSFGLDEKDKPAGEILRNILKLANPDGKLIYVIKKEGDQEVIYITTRAGAAKRNDPIPPELQQ